MSVELLGAKVPGFQIGIEPDDTGIPMPALPIYNYTWSLDQLVATNIRINSPLIYVKDATLPEFVVETEEVQGSSLKYKYAKGVTWNDVKFIFYATGDLLIELDALKANVWTPEGGLQPANNYKFMSVLSQYYADDTTLAQTWTLLSSFIKGISHSNLTYTQSDVYNVTTTVAYDWATVGTAELLSAQEIQQLTAIGKLRSGDLPTIQSNG